METIAYQGKSLIKTTWDEVGPHVAKIDPEFARLVNELSPGKEFPLYLAYYRYGDVIGDTETSLIPNESGQLIKLTDPELPADLFKDLGYGSWGAPFGMVLDKNVEWRAWDDSLPLLLRLLKPGGFFSSAYFLGDSKPNKPLEYGSNSVMVAIAGARSGFMLPAIGESTRHEHLKTAFRIRTEPAKELHEHGKLFKSILDTPMADCDWRACLLYFSEPWVDALFEDLSWRELKFYLIRHFNRLFAFQRQRSNYDTVFSLIQQQKNLRQNPYLLDTAKHLLYIACGVAPCFMPATTEQSLPLSKLQDIFVNIYHLEEYFPTIMEPGYLDLEQDLFGGYYSLQYPSLLDFTPHSRKAGILTNLRELELISTKLKEAISQKGCPLSDARLGRVIQNLNLEYYHNQVDPQWITRLSAKLGETDPRLKFVSPGIEISRAAEISTDTAFMRGCINLTKFK